MASPEQQTSAETAPEPTAAGDDAGPAPTVAATLLLAVLVAAIYANSVSAPFVYDDHSSIVHNTSIRRLWPLRDALAPPGDGATVSGRPVLNLSFALDYARAALDVHGFHVTNIAIHAVATLALFGLIRRTLQGRAFRESHRRASLPIALASAAAWAAHPLQTESVTYLAQRAESLMGCFFLLTLYCFARSTDPARAPVWRSLAVLACGLGMATKENMVSAPIAVLLYDRAFVAGSFAAAWRARRGVYMALGSTWGILALLLASTGGNRNGSAGFDVGVGWLPYVLTQPPALVRYAVLSVWPHPLVFDYGAFFITKPRAIALELAFALALLAGIGYALWRHPKAGFLGATALAVLAPTALVPGTTQMIVEHRMYLPLAAVVVALAMLAGLGRRPLVGIATIGIVAALGVLTVARNEAYRSNLTLWADTVAKRPENAVARSSLGAALADAGRRNEAVVEHRAALRLDPDHAPTLANLALALSESGRAGEALPYVTRAIAIAPQNAQVQLNLGVTLDLLHRSGEALPHYAAAVRLNPLLAAARNDYGDALSRAGRPDQACAQLREAIRLQPGYPEAHFNLGAALVRAGRLAEGRAEFAIGCQFRPADPAARLNWATFLYGQGHRAAALGEFETAFASGLDTPDAHYSYATALAAEGRHPDAIREYEKAIQLRPEYAAAHNNLGNTLTAAGRIAEAIPHYETALRLRPDDANTCNNLGLALARTGRIREAEAQFAAAVALAPEFRPAQDNLARARAQLRAMGGR